tara:strand:- start:4873 stop:5259 length:387 start_codon:yes stop_codon:yes gene_type:complete
MADEKAFDMTTKDRDTSRGPQNLQALRDMARRVLEAVKETGVNFVEGMPRPTMPQELRDIRSPEEEEAYQEDVRRSEREYQATQPQILDVPDDPPFEGFPPAEALESVSPAKNTPKRKKKSIDNPYGG